MRKKSLVVLLLSSVAMLLGDTKSVYVGNMERRCL